jgi:hypothetical protein
VPKYSLHTILPNPNTGINSFKAAARKHDFEVIRVMLDRERRVGVISDELTVVN